MARFSRAFLQSLTQPSYGKGLFEFGKGLSMTPRLVAKQKEEERRQKGLLGGLMAIEQAASSGTLDPEMIRQAAGSLQGLGMSPEEIMETMQTASTLNKQVQKEQKTEETKNRAYNYFNSRGTEYGNQFILGVEPSKILKNIQEQDQIDGKISIGTSLGLPPEVSAGLTSNELADRLDDKKEEEGLKAWGDWIKQNPEITPENRSQALNAALQAFGKDAPSKIADIELKQLQLKEQQNQRNLREVKVTLNSSSLLAGGFGEVSKIKTEKLAFDDNGNFTPETVEWLKAHATHAFEPISGESWTSGSNNDTLTDSSTSQQDSSNTTPTLGQLIQGRR